MKVYTDYHVGLTKIWTSPLTNEVKLMRNIKYFEYVLSATQPEKLLHYFSFYISHTGPVSSYLGLYKFDEIMTKTVRQTAERLTAKPFTS